jgi:DNA-binding MarR family transcriptional regulator
MELHTRGADCREDSGPAFEEYVLNANRIVVAFGESGILADNNVTLGEWAVLRAIQQNGEASSIGIGSLVRDTGVSRQRVCQLLKSLMGKNLVSLAKDITDKRNRNVSLDPNAMRMLHKISASFAEMSEITTGVKGTKIARCNEVGKHLLRALHKACNSRMPNCNEQ